MSYTGQGAADSIFVWDGTKHLWVPRANAGGLWYEWGGLTTGNSAGGARFYQSQSNVSAASPTEADSEKLITINGTLVRLTLRYSNAALATQTTITIRINGVDSAAVLVVPSGTQQATATFSVAVVQGDRITCRSVTVAADNTNCRTKVALLMRVAAS